MTPKKRVSASRSKIKRAKSYFDWKLPELRWSKTKERWEPKYMYYRREDSASNDSKS